MVLLYPPASFRPVRNTSGMMAQPIRGLIPHVQVGTGSLFTLFDSAATKVSAHLWLSRTGQFEQYVGLERRAWAQAAGNPYWISCECEGFPNEDYTLIQVLRLAELYRWGMRMFGWRAQITDSPEGFGLGTHRMGGLDWGGHSCPGEIRANRRAGILALAVGHPASAANARERYASRPTLRLAATGPDVRELQNALNVIFGQGAPNSVPSHLDPDGVFGPRTSAQVTSLQRLASTWSGPISADGVCGPATWKKIGEILTGLKNSC